MIAVILAKKILSLFLIMIMGAALVKSNVLKTKDSKSLSVITLYLVMPCVIISSFQVAYTEEIRDGLILALIAAVLVHIILIVLTEILGRALHWDPVERASAIYSNAGNLIIPIVTALLGKEWIIYTSAFLSVQLILLWSHGKMTLCGEKKIELKKIATNVNMISIFIGILFFVCRIQLPAVLQDSIDTVGGMVGPAAMIVTGMLIGNMDLKKLASYKRLWLMVVIRLIAYPILNIVFLKYSGLAAMVPAGDTILMITLLATITPSASTITQMAQVYGKDADYASAINVATTLLCIVTMPLMVMIYQL